jgi:hypothetical protein
MPRPSRVLSSKHPEPKPAGRKDPPDWAQWVSHRHLRRELRVGYKTIHELLDECAIPHHTGEDGTKKYPPDTVEKVRPYLLDEDGEKPVQIGHELVEAAAKLLHQSEEHNRGLVEVMVAPMKLALETLRAETVRLTERNKSLEDSRDVGIKAREELLSAVAARDIAARESQAAEDRKTQAWKLILERAPKLLDQIQTSIVGKSPAVQEQIASTIALLSSIEPIQLQALLETNFLTAEQVGHVQKILAAAPSAKQSEPPKAETTNGKKS